MTEKLVLEMVMYTCRERESTRAATLASLGETDWRADFRLVLDDQTTSLPSRGRMARNFARAIDVAAHSKSSFVVIVEDDLRWNHHLEHNLRSWLKTFRPNDVGALYRSDMARDVGTQAIVATPARWLTLHRIADTIRQPIDVWLRSKVAMVRNHTPSLVQHTPHTSTVGNPAHRSNDFDRDWRAQ